MYRIYFTNFNYYSANTAENLEGAKRIARQANFDSVIEFNKQIICTYRSDVGFQNFLDETG